MRSSGIVLAPDQCPADPEEIAEAYLLDLLAPEEALAFEDHYLTCARCAGIVEEMGAYVVAMKRAAERLRPKMCSMNSVNPHLSRDARESNRKCS